MLMQIIFALMLIVSTTYAVVAIDRDNPTSEREARQQVDNLRGFALSVNRYVSANLDYSGSVSWAGSYGGRALRDAKSTPASLRGVNLSPDWYAVVGEGQYTLCIQGLSPTALAMLSQSFPTTITQNVLAKHGGRTPVVFAQQGEFAASGGQSSHAQNWVKACNQRQL